MFVEKKQKINQKNCYKGNNNIALKRKKCYYFIVGKNII